MESSSPSIFPVTRLGICGGDSPALLGFNTWNRSAAQYVRIQPHVILSMYDASVRCSSDFDGVVGTILGYVSEYGAIEVTDCFQTLYVKNANEVVSIVGDRNIEMLELQTKLFSRNEKKIVGCVFVGNKLNEFACAIHGWYRNYSANSKFVGTTALPEPILLYILTDVIGYHIVSSNAYLPLNPHPCGITTTEKGTKLSSLLPRQGMRKGRYSVRAYCQIPTKIGQESFVNFYELPVVIADDFQLKNLLVNSHIHTLNAVKSNKVSNTNLNLVKSKLFADPNILHNKLAFPLSVLTNPQLTPEIRNSSVTLPSANNSISILSQNANNYDNMELFATKLQHFSELLLAASEYVECVVNGEEEADSIIGRLMYQIASGERPFPLPVLSQLEDHGKQDCLIMNTIINNVRTQVAVSEKLNTSFV